MTCEGERNSAVAMNGRPMLGLLPHIVCNAVVCPSASHWSRLIPLVPLNPTYPALSRLIPLNPT